MTLRPLAAVFDNQSLLKQMVSHISANVKGIQINSYLLNCLTCQKIYLEKEGLQLLHKSDIPLTLKLKYFAEVLALHPIPDEMLKGQKLTLEDKINYLKICQSLSIRQGVRPSAKKTTSPFEQ